MPYIADLLVVQLITPTGAPVTANTGKALLVNGRSRIIRLASAAALIAPLLALAPATAQAATACTSSQQYAFNDQWRGTFCVTRNSSGATTGVSIKGDANGFPNFSGCQVYARWWSAGNVNQANSAWMTCATMLSKYPNGFPWNFAATQLQGIQLCGTFVFKNVNTGQYWGAAQGVCQNG